MKIAIPSSTYHKNFSSKLIHNFILLVRETCGRLNIEYVDKDQESFGEFTKSDQKPFDVLISMGFTALTPELSEFYRRHDIRVILFQDDIHGKDDKDLRKKIKWMQFADILLIPYYKNFLSRPEYVDCHNKAIDFPWFAPRSCFKHDRLWNDRKNKIIVSGCMASVYSLRRNLRELAGSIKCIDVLDHPGYKPRKRKHQIIGDEYYNLLSEYKCAVATSADAPLNYPLSKYFEIPACGCIGLFEQIEELSNFGFEKNKHYVSITKDDYREAIKDIAKNFDKLEGMATLCRKHVLNNHTDTHRVRQLIKILNGL